MNQEQPNIVVSDRPPVKRWGLWLLIPLLAGIAVLFEFSLEWKESLQIQRIVVEGARNVSAQEIFALAKLPASAPMFGVDLYGVEQRILGHAFVKSAAIERQYPDALRISIVERVPIASVNAGKMWYVDRVGVFMPHGQAMKLDLPVIAGLEVVDRVQAGSKLSSNDLPQAIDLLKTAQSIDSSVYHFISEVNMKGGGNITLFSSEAGIPILIGRGDIARKLVLLQTFWSNFVKAENTEKLQYIDLRFDDQIVVKWNQQEHSTTKAAL